MLATKFIFIGWISKIIADKYNQRINDCEYALLHCKISQNGQMWQIKETELLNSSQSARFKVHKLTTFF